MLVTHISIYISLCLTIFIGAYVLTTLGWVIMLLISYCLCLINEPLLNNVYLQICSALKVLFTKT